MYVTLNSGVNLLCFLLYFLLILVPPSSFGNKKIVVVVIKLFSSSSSMNNLARPDCVYAHCITKSSVYMPMFCLSKQSCSAWLHSVSLLLACM